MVLRRYIYEDIVYKTRDMTNDIWKVDNDQ
jgi:hypothetical protein